MCRVYRHVEITATAYYNEREYWPHMHVDQNACGVQKKVPVVDVILQRTPPRALLSWLS
jgi:hypothetical protein